MNHTTYHVRCSLLILISMQMIFKIITIFFITTMDHTIRQCQPYIFYGIPNLYPDIAESH